MPNAEGAENRAAVDAVLSSLELLQLVTDLLPAYISYVDAEQRYRLVNRLYEEWFQLPREQIVGRYVRDIQGAEAYAQMRDSIERALAGEALHYENPLVNVDGCSKVFDTNYIPHRGPRGEILGFCVLVFDATERKRNEEERRKFEQQMQQAQKLESLALLAGGVAHDFNNLLQIVLGHADLARTHLSPQAPASQDLQRIEAAALRAAELTNLMLAYSGQGKFVSEPLNLSLLAREMMQLLEFSISKKAALQANLASDLPAVEADAAQMRQVVLNLITNAAEAIGGPGGQIAVTTGVTHVDSPAGEAALTGWNVPAGDYVFLEVADNGCGMDAPTRARMFEPFFSTKSPGRGLGLAAVSGIVRGHRGGLQLETQPGAGTRIRVLLPACRQAARSADAPPDDAAPNPAGSGTVLVVDDEDLVRNVVRSLLEAAGYDVLTASGGRPALELCRDPARHIEVVLLDLTMPEMDGAETFRELQRLRPELPVILSSGYIEEEATRQFRGGGLAHFLQKPFRAAQLLEAVRSVLGRTSAERRLK